MSSGTTFRKTLMGQLAALVDTRELEDRLVQTRYVEEKDDLLGEFLDYYTDELLKYDSFASEFDPSEIDHLRRFLNYIQVGAHGPSAWSEVQVQAASLLKCLHARVV